MVCVWGERCVGVCVEVCGVCGVWLCVVCVLREVLSRVCVCEVCVCECVVCCAVCVCVCLLCLVSTVLRCGVRLLLFCL